jgi:hypothetical protein
MVAAIHAETLDKIQYMNPLKLNNQNTLDAVLEEIKKRKIFESVFMCGCVWAYLHLLFLPGANVATTSKPRFFTWKPEEKANLRRMSFTESAWLQEKWLLVNSHYIRIFRKL